MEGLRLGKRRSIIVEGYGHGNQPIPAASRVGPLIMTGGVHGLDPATGEIPDDLSQQVRLMFENLERIMIAAEAGLDAIVRVTVYVKVPEARPLVNAEWLRAFPDEASRPARHTHVNEHLPLNMLVQCDATAFCDAELGAAQDG
jgi:2-iminobutanoate/2-iminopropanoate deaminase